jgi:mono/diheme cytochrome c family protein
MKLPTLFLQTFTRRQVGFVLFAALCIIVSEAEAQETAEYFMQNCMSCHTVGGGRLTGPDLKDVQNRKDREWLEKFITDPRAVLNSGDPYAKSMMEEARGAVMPNFPTMTRKRAAQLLDLIAAESKLEKSQFVGVQVSNRPFTSADIRRGERLFLGTERLENEGAACISCHAVNGISGLGGGTLAPDLTTVYERYEGRKTLAAWLSAPATPTMQSVFKSRPLSADEVLAMTAYFEHTLQRNPDDPSTARLNFLLVGIGAALLLLGVFDVIWNKRFRSARRALVNEANSKVRQRAEAAEKVNS